MKKHWLFHLNREKIESTEAGSALLVVVSIAAVLLLLGATTLYRVKTGLKQSGTQRASFQSLHAGEAGIAFVQNRLNALTMCNPWFTRDDSLAVVGIMHDTVVPMLNIYGAKRAFKVNHIQFIPQARPIRMSFISEGGIYDSVSGQLKAGGHRAVKVTLRMRTLADFARFTEGGTISYGSDANIKGRVHSGGNVTLTGPNITFNKLVTYVTTLSISSGVSPSTIVFRQGHEQNATNPMSLNHIHISTSETRPQCGSSLARTYQELAQGTVPNEGQGFAYTGSSPSTVLIPLDSVIISGSKVRMPWYNFDSTRANLIGTRIRTDSVALATFNGVVYADADVMVMGRLRGVSLSIASTDDILAVGNITCLGNETRVSDNRVTLGLISQDKFLVWGKTPTHTTIEAVIVAEGDAAASKGGFNGTYSNWEALGTSTSHPGTDSLGNAASNAVAANWQLRMVGGIITQAGGSAGPWASISAPAGVVTRVYDFDNDMLYSPPPKFLLVRAQSSGLPLWEVADWEEIPMSEMGTP
jgi:hypothetical protein